MKERPILFNDAMVRAILEGRKTQTRRVAPITDLDIKANSDGIVTWGVRFSRPVKGALSSYSGGCGLSDLQARSIIAARFNPYGQPGDRLWVRECFSAIGNAERDGWPIFYRADQYRDDGFHRWRPSIHMPRWACRLVLEITGVRVERLNEITPADALAEGVFCPEIGYAQHGERAPVGGFASLWESINGPGSWDANPWVWVVEFRRLP